MAKRFEKIEKAIKCVSDAKMRQFCRDIRPIVTTDMSASLAEDIVAENGGEVKVLAPFIESEAQRAFDGELVAMMQF